MIGPSVGVVSELVSPSNKHWVGPGKLTRQQKLAQLARGSKASTLAAVSVQIGWFMDPGVAKKQWFWLVLWVMYVPGGSHTTYLKVKIFMTCSDLGLNFLPLTWYLTSSLVFLLKSLWVSIFLSVNQYNNTNLPELFFCFVYFLYIVRDDVCKSLENYLTPY